MAKRKPMRKVRKPRHLCPHYDYEDELCLGCNSKLFSTCACCEGGC